MMIGHCCHCEYIPGHSSHPRICSVFPDRTDSDGARWEEACGWPGEQDLTTEEWEEFHPSLHGYVDEIGTSRWVIRNITASIGETVYLQRIKITILSSNLFMGYSSSGSPNSYKNLLGSTRVDGINGLPGTAFPTFGPGPAGLPQTGPLHIRTFTEQVLTDARQHNHPLTKAGRGMTGRRSEYSRYQGSGLWGVNDGVSYGLVQNEFLDKYNHTGHLNSDPIELRHFAPPICEVQDSDTLGSGYDTWQGIGHMWIKSMQIDNEDVEYNDLEDTTDSGTLKERWNNFNRLERMGSRLSGSARNIGMQAMRCPKGIEIPPNLPFTVTLGLAITRFASLPANPDEGEKRPFTQFGPDPLVITEGDLFGFGQGRVSTRRVTSMTFSEGEWINPVYDYLEGDTAGGMAMFVTPSNVRYDPKEFFYRLKFFAGPRGSSEYPEFKEIDLRGDGVKIGAHGIYKRLNDNPLPSDRQGVLLAWENEVPYIAYENGSISTITNRSNTEIERQAFGIWAPLDISRDGEMQFSSRDENGFFYNFGGGWPITYVHNQTDFFSPNPLPVAWDGISTQTFLLVQPIYHHLKNSSIYGGEPWTFETIRYQSIKTCRYCEISTVYYADL